MPDILLRSAMLGATALIALSGTSAFAAKDKPAGNDIAIETLTIQHESFEPSPKQTKDKIKVEQDAAPQPQSSGGSEWKYLPVRRY